MQNEKRLNVPSAIIHIRIVGENAIGWLTANSKSRRAVAVSTSLLLHASVVSLFLLRIEPDFRGMGNGALQGINMPSFGEAPLRLALVKAQHAPSEALPAPKTAEPKTVSAKADTLTVFKAAPTTSAPTEMLQLDATLEDKAPYQSSDLEANELGSAPTPPSQAAAQAGALDGSATLVEQIARCLPKDARPILQHASLNVPLDINGNLSSAPSLNLNLEQMSETEIRDANLVVQATLQCGPYRLPTPIAQTFVIVPDFRGLWATQPAS